MKFRRTATILLLLVSLAGIGAAASGCAGSLPEWKATRDKIVIVKTETDKAILDIQAEILKLPEDDPVRKIGEEKMAKLIEFNAKADKYLASLNAIIVASETGDISNPAMRDAVKDIPYGYLGVILLSFGVNLYQRIQKAKNDAQFNQAVIALDKVAPGATLENPNVSSELDEATKVRAAGVIAALPDLKE